MDENYDPTEFFTGLGGGMVGEQHTNGAGNGNGQVKTIFWYQKLSRFVIFSRLLTICKMTLLSVMIVRMKRGMEMMIRWRYECIFYISPLYLI